MTPSAVELCLLPEDFASLRVTNRIAARVEECASKDVRITQRETQRHSRSTGEPTYVGTRRIHMEALHDVMRSQQRQGFAAIKNVCLVSRIRGADENHAVAIQYRGPTSRQHRILPRRYEHQ